MTPQQPGRPRGRLRLLLVPLLTYLTVTLIVPLANGAARGAGFGEHALTALIVPVLMTTLWAALRRGASRS